MGSQPEATGFAAAVLRPALRAAWSRPAAMVVLPISVSVPVTKNAGMVQESLRSTPKTTR